MNRVKYNYRLFALHRLSGLAWRTVPSATFTWSSDYTLADHTEGVPPSPVSTLVLGSETATVSLSRWDTQGDILFTGDKVRAMYAGRIFFYGTVESVSVTTVADPAAAKHGALKRLDITAAVGGFYADLLSRTVHWPDLPEEKWYPDRINRLFDLDGHGVEIVGW